MSLQLYQVDYKSYLLDFKSLSCEEQDKENVHSSKFSSLNNTLSIFHLIISYLSGSEMLAMTGPSHHTMEFFEMCAALITQLAR